MNIDNITDIETLKEKLKNTMVQVKEDFTGYNSKTGEEVVYKKGHWYDVQTDWMGIHISKNIDENVCLSEDEAKKYLVTK